MKELCARLLYRTRMQRDGLSGTQRETVQLHQRKRYAARNAAIYAR